MPTPKTPKQDLPRRELPNGTLEMLILKTISVGTMHGYGIAQHIQRVTDGVLSAEQGSLYPALERLLNKGHATAKWAQTSTGRQARIYTITASGRKQLAARMADYEQVSLAIERLLQA
ncbi:MAG TPA: PadR family transcriptional regulator [Gemmatimonas aurantiaca]|uniref:PadR family transcriptional regulator n=2 Tax=Gemmatimonas aurantiaca TaxID=173480 RepID=C1A3M6_GEMAT|nr:PadR family transcriptional regulator [Gemmatimonas aurantiaca]BAH37103.1 PadR family transcriptional regulator [Gemmatimonas aurantiaca T-27]HCT58864.1 PadR family transcriptional regulator [Gemmatimonas aurantiaca]